MSLYKMLVNHGFGGKYWLNRYPCKEEEVGRYRIFTWIWLKNRGEKRIYQGKVLGVLFIIYNSVTWAMLSLAG